MEKYRELFNSSKYVLDEELKRSARIDDKASKYLAVLIVMFGLLSFLFKWSLDAFTPFIGVLDYVGILLLLLFTLFLALAFYLCFRVLKIHERLVMPMNDEMINFYNDNRLIDIYFALSKKFKKAYQENKMIGDRKGIQLYWGYKFIICSFIIMVLLLPLMGFRAYNKKIENKEVICMADEERNSSQNSGSSHNNQGNENQEKPDSSVDAPEFTWRTEGYKPSKEKKKKEK